MEKGQVVYANHDVQMSLNNKVVGGLSDFFDVRFAGELCPELIEDLKVYLSKFGLVTHFPYDMSGSGNDLYAGAVQMIGNLRENKSDLSIVVYSAEYPMACRGDETLANFLSQNNDY